MINLANSLEAKGEADQATELLQNFLASHPNDARVLNELGLLKRAGDC